MLSRALEQFLKQVAWGELDYLVIDMPPGTGDIQMALARMVPQAEMVVVTTPQMAAQKVAIRVADMARRSLPARRRCHREHGRVHMRPRRDLQPLWRRRRARTRRVARRSPDRLGSRSTRRWSAVATPACPWCGPTPTTRRPAPFAAAGRAAGGARAPRRRRDLHRPHRPPPRGPRDPGSRPPPRS